MANMTRCQIPLEGLSEILNHAENGSLVDYWISIGASHAVVRQQAIMVSQIMDKCARVRNMMLDAEIELMQNPDAFGFLSRANKR